MKITDIHNPWRDAWLPASFRGARFHVAVGSKDGGRRIVAHEYPKKEYGYAEDMGRQTNHFTVRGYCIAYPRNQSGPGLELYNRDYRIARDILDAELQRQGEGVLQLPLLKPMVVVCHRYRLTEETRFGGFCTFDMEFTEFGKRPLTATTSTIDNLIQKAIDLRDVTTGQLTEGLKITPAEAGAGAGPVEEDPVPPPGRMTRVDQIRVR